MAGQAISNFLPRAHQYNPIRDRPYASEKGGNLPSAENDAFLAAEDQLHLPRRAQRGWRSFFYTITALSIAIILAFVALRIVNSAPNPWAAERNPIPQFRTEIYIIHPDDGYEAPANLHSNELWDSNLPGGKGFLHVDDAQQFGLPPGLPSADNGTSTYGVTWTHEYHCLKLVREEFWNAIYGTSKLYGGYEADPPLSKYHARRLHHVQHCMNYVRQLIMCRADMTIEWAAPYPDALGNENHIDGYGIPHQCTNWDDMFTYMLNKQPLPKKHGEHEQHH